MHLPNTFDHKKLKEFCTNIFMKAGSSIDNARIVSESLIQANLRGVDSHGVVRTAIYLKRIEEKMIDPTIEVLIEKESDATALINGGNNFGAVVGDRALKVAMNKAKESGISVVGAKHSNHFGTGAYYALQAIEKNFVALIMSNASQTMPPTGGIRPFLGTNPLAVGIPTGNYHPFILDMATSVASRGKIIVASQKKERIPEGWAIDKHGNPTTNAEEALEGSVLPLGGPKGYGISMFIDILSGVLTGAGFGKYVNNMYNNWEEAQNVGHFFIVIDVNKFMPINDFKERMDVYITDIKSEPKAPNVEEIFIPGEIETRLEKDRKKNGIVLTDQVVKELQEIGEKYHLNFTDSAIDHYKGEGVN